MPVAPTTEPVTSTPQPPARPLWRTVLTPHWSGLLLLALAIAAVMSVLGVWQLDVYRSKTEAATAKRAEAAPVSLQSLFPIDAGLPSKAVGRRVTVAGSWGPAADQIFVSDRRVDDRDGYWVVTPLLLDQTSQSVGATDGRPSGAVMVVRGWVASVDDPAATPPSGDVAITGAVASSEAQDSSGDAAKGRVLQSLRIPTIVHLVDYRIYDAFVVLASSTPATAADAAPVIVPAPSPPTDHEGLRNIAYAFQWWIFAAFTLWMWGRMVLDAHRSADADQADDDVEASGTVSA
jgi:surfeit locus 1 family protein